MGAALLPDARPRLLLLWAVAVVGVLAEAWLVSALQAPLAQAALGAALGGATGNLADSLQRNAVVDFIDLGFWPIFNVADIAIVIGAGVALLHLLSR